MQNVIGSALGGDRLTGNALGNILVGHNKGNLLVAGTGRSVLIGGGGTNRYFTPFPFAIIDRKKGEQVN